MIDKREESLKRRGRERGRVAKMRPLEKLNYVLELVKIVTVLSLNISFG